MSENNKNIGEITEILSRWNNSDEDSLHELFPKVYEKLRTLAKRSRRDIGRIKPDETYSTESLVNEIYIELRKERKDKPLNFASRGKFYAFCILCMKTTLHDYYLRKSSKKNEVQINDEAGDSAETPTAAESAIAKQISFLSLETYKAFSDSLELSIMVNEVLSKLADAFPLEVEVIILRYWLDKTIKEIAEELNISEATVKTLDIKGRALIKFELDNKIKPILKKAAVITNTTLRKEYLKTACDKDKHLLKYVTFILEKESELLLKKRAQQE